MATEILLTSETFVKNVTSISDNIAGKYLRPSIREAQEVGFRGIVGDTLLAKLKALVGDGSISQEANIHYKDLLDRSQYVLAYLAIVEVAQKVNFKIANAGVVKTPDDNVQTVDATDMNAVQDYYQAKADSAVLDLQNWLLNNYADFPELTQGDVHRIHANLYSAASCGVFLGGPRGKRLPGDMDLCKWWIKR